MFKMKKIGYWKTCHIYVIYLEINEIESFIFDDCIAFEINLHKYDYQRELKQFGATHNSRGEKYFLSQKKCQKCCDYLNEKYGTMFKLIKT